MQCAATQCSVTSQWGHLAVKAAGQGDSEAPRAADRDAPRELLGALVRDRLAPGDMRSRIEQSIRELGLF